MTHARMLHDQLTAGLPDEERCNRAVRATEIERVVAELRRAALAVLSDEPLEPAAEERLRGRVIASRFMEPVAVLNLMGIETLYPGEPSFDVRSVLPAGTRIPLRGGPGTAQVNDAMDALSGLIGDFRRSTIFVNGLRIDQTHVDHEVQSAVVAVHPAIMIAFGEFLTQKFVIEGWSLA